VQATTLDGQTINLPDNRKPALYTNSFEIAWKLLINVTRFDAAYYNDNMTVLSIYRGIQQSGTRV
jgi:hypothetical protein